MPRIETSGGESFGLSSWTGPRLLRTGARFASCIGCSRAVLPADQARPPGRRHDRGQAGSTPIRNLSKTSRACDIIGFPEKALLGGEMKQVLARQTGRSIEAFKGKLGAVTGFTKVTRSRLASPFSLATLFHKAFRR